MPTLQWFRDEGSGFALAPNQVYGRRTWLAWTALMCRHAFTYKGRGCGYACKLYPMHAVFKNVQALHAHALPR